MSIKLYNDTCVLRTQTIIGDWSNGMRGVSKTFGGSSILSAPACEKALKALYLLGFRAFFFVPGYSVSLYSKTHNYVF